MNNFRAVGWYRRCGVSGSHARHTMYEKSTFRAPQMTIIHVDHCECLPHRLFFHISSSNEHKHARNDGKNAGSGPYTDYLATCVPCTVCDTAPTIETNRDKYVCMRQSHFLLVKYRNRHDERDSRSDTWQIWKVNSSAMANCKPIDFSRGNATKWSHFTWDDPNTRELINRDRQLYAGDRVAWCDESRGFQKNELIDYHIFIIHSWLSIKVDFLSFVNWINLGSPFRRWCSRRFHFLSKGKC